MSGAATSQIQGGVISNSGDLKVSNSTFSGNEALSTASVKLQSSTPNATVLGGVIHNSGNLSIDHSTFSDNTASATKSGSTGGSANSYGGAIYNDGTLNINSTSFSNNKDNQGANDIYFASNSKMNVTGTGRENAWKDNDDAVIIGSGLASADDTATINIESGGKLIMEDANSGTTKYTGEINIKKDGVLGFKDGVLGFNTSSTSIQYAIYKNKVKITENYGGIEVLGSATGILRNFKNFIKDGVDRIRLIKSNDADETVTGNLADVGGSILINKGKLIYQAENSDDNFFNAKTSETILNDGTEFEYDTSTYKTQDAPATLGNLKTQGTNNTGIFSKTGDGYLLLSGDNSNYLGTVNIKKGVLSYLANDENARFFNSQNVNFADGTVLNIDTNGVSNQAGGNFVSENSNAEINKTGSGNFELTGDNSDYDGILNVNEGTLSFNKTNTTSYINGTTTVQYGAGLNYTTTVDDSLSNISGQGVLNKLGDADLELIGDASGLKGGINIEKGSLSFEKNSSSAYADAPTYIANFAVLNYKTTLNDNIKDISGDGTLNKSGVADLALTSDNSGFKGVANINEGSLTFVESNSDKFFDSQATVNIKNSTLNYTAANGDNTLTTGTFGTLSLSDGATLNYTSGMGTTNLNDGFYNSTGNNNLVFNGVSNSNYVLNTDFSSNTSDTVRFIDAVVNFGTKSVFQTKIALNNSTMNLMDGSLKSYTFNDFWSENNSNLTIDVSLGETLGSDKLNIVNGNGTFNINSLSILDDNGIFPEGSNNTKTVQVIDNTNGSVGINVADPDNLTIAAWSTNVYEYDINASKTADSAVYNAVDFVGKQAANTNSLKKMNNYTASLVRGFSLVNGAPTYYIDEDLAKTEKGTLTVNGVSSADSVISGVRNGSGDEKGSFFELTDSEATNLIVKNVTIQDASRTTQTIQDGSILYMDSAGAKAELNNVVLKNSSVMGRGGAIAVLNGELSITDSTFEGNSAGGVSNDIYISGGNTVKFTTSDNTSSKISSGLSGDGALEKLGVGALNLSGVNKDFTGNLTISQGIVDYVQSAGGSFVGGSVSMANNTTLNISNSNDDKLNGLTSATTSAIFNKSGSGNLTVSGDNSRFLGTVNINEGTLNYKAENEFSKFFNSQNIKLADGTSLIVDTNGQLNQSGKNISSVSSDAQFIKTGDGDFELRGNNYNFTGQLNINEGSLTFEKIGTNSFVNGEVNISDGATLNYIASDNDTVTNLTNAGTLVKDGNEVLTIKDYNFTGNGLAEIKAGTLKVLSSAENARDFDITANIYANSTLDYVAKTGSIITLDNNSNLNFANKNSNATAIISNANVILGKIANETGNNIVLDNANIVLLNGKYSGNYTVQNGSTLNLMNKEISSLQKIETYNFNKFVSDGTNNLTIDVSLGDDLSSDVLNIADGNGNLSLTRLAILEDNGIFENEEKTKTIQVIKNTAGSVGLYADGDNPKLADWSTNIYEYEISAVKSDESSGIFDSIEFKGAKVASPDTLRTMNHEKNNLRGFSVVGTNAYHIAQDLDTTLSGEFVVTGNNKNSSVISGERVSYIVNPDGTITYEKDADGNYIIDTGNKGSFFEVVQDNTKLTLQNLTIQDASRTTQTIQDGSILYMDSAGAKAELNNVVLKNSSVMGRGGAIAVLNGELSITDSTFEGNSAGGVSNDIYISGGNTVKFTTSDNTSSKISSGLSGDGALEKLGVGALNLSGVNKDFTGNLTISQGIVDYVQSAGGSFIGGSVNVANATSKLNITNEYTDNIKNLSGNGLVTKAGSGNLILSGNNLGFDGQFNVTDGEFIVNIDSNTDTFFGNDSKTILTSGTKIDFDIAEGQSYTVDNGGNLISGKGQLIKTGEGTLVLTGDNSNLKGDVVNSVGQWSNQLRTGTVVRDGILEFVANDTADKMVDGAVQIDTNGTFKVTSTNGTFNLFNDAVDLYVYQGGLHGDGKFITSGDINLSGNNYNFTGRTEIENGTLTFIKTGPASFVQGVVDIKSDAAINYSTDSHIGEKIVTLVGDGTFSKAGSGELEISSTAISNERFTGTVNVNSGILNIRASQANLNEFDFNANVNSNSTLNYIANADNEYILDDTSKVHFGDGVSGANINFSNGKYNLAADLTNSAGNTTGFKDATVNVTTAQTDKQFAGDYVTDSNSTLNINMKDGSYNNLKFAGLYASGNNNLNLDVDFTGTDSDTITIDNGSGTLIISNLSDIGIVGNDNGASVNKSYNVIFGSAVTLSVANDMTYDSGVYEYLVSATSDNKLLFAAQELSEYGLYHLNHEVSNDRTFNFIGGNTYYIKQNLDTTLAGTLNIIGRTETDGTRTGDTIVAKENSAATSGLSMFEITESGTTLNIKNVEINSANKTATNAGGSVIYATADDAVVNIENSLITNNSAYSSGGVIYTEGDNAVVNLINTDITNNKSTNGNGVVKLAGGTVNVQGGSFSGNQALFGGAIASLNRTTMQTNNVFLNVDGTVFNGNTASSAGGAMSLGNIVTAEIKNTTFEGNKATNNGSGGAIHTNGSAVTIVNSTFKDNSADSVGGAINNDAWNSTGTVIRNTSFANNKANTSGSAIYNAGNMQITDTTFSGNGNNGQSYIYNIGTMTIAAETSNLTLSNDVEGISGTKIVNNGILNLNANSKYLTIKDAIESDLTGNNTINTNGDISFAKQISDQKVNVKSGVVTFGDGSKQEVPVLNGVDLTLAQGTGVMLSQGNVRDGSITLNYNSTFSIFNTLESYVSAKISGNGTIYANIGGQDLSLAGDNDNSGFHGIFNINSGTVKFEKTAANQFFAPDATVNISGGSSKLDYTATEAGEYILDNNNFSNINLINGASFALTGAGNSATYTLNNDWFTSDTNSNNFEFNNANYVLNTTFNKASGSADNISFKDSVIKLGTISKNDSDVYDMGNAQYTLSSSTLDLSNRVAGDNYVFDTLNMTDDSKLSLDVNLVYDVDESGAKPYSDTITANSGSGIVEVTKIFITDDNGKMDADGTKGIMQVFKGNNTLKVADINDAQILSWATNIYKYGIKSAQTTREADSIKITADGPSSTDTLRDLNRYNINETPSGGNRGFSYVASTQAENKYNIFRNLDTTSSGTFTVIGKLITDGSDTYKSVLDGQLQNLIVTAGEYNLSDPDSRLQKDINGNYYYDGELIASDMISFDGNGNATIQKEAFSDKDYGSMFEIVNETDFEMINVSVQNAKRYDNTTVKDGSVLYANNGNANVLLDNVDLINNEVKAGYGGAVANIDSRTFVLKDSVISGNSASKNGETGGNGGAVYNTSNGTTSIINALAYNNKAEGLGGAIYTASDMTITDSDFGIDKDGNQSLNYHKTDVQNDIYIDGENTKLEFVTNTNNTIQSGIAGDGQFIKTGAGILNLNGDNKDFTGLLSVNSGNLIYTADNSNTFVSGNVNIGQNGHLTMNVIESLNYALANQILGNGTFEKSGLGSISISGDKSGFTGNTLISEGSLVYNPTTSSDKYFGGTTTVKNAANLTLNIASDIENQSITGISGESGATVTKTGSGIITLNGDNSEFLGTTEINGGTLKYVADDTSDKYLGGKTVINTSATLEANIGTSTSEQTISNISGTGAFNKTGLGTLSLAGDNSGFSGKTSISGGGTLTYVADGINKFVAGEVYVNGSNANTLLKLKIGNATTLSNNFSGDGLIEKAGSKILTVSGSNNANFSGNVIVSEGSLVYKPTTSSDKYFGGTTTVKNAANLTLNIASDIENQSITGISGESGATVTKTGSGIITLSGDNSGFSGVTTIEDGTLKYNATSDSHKYLGGQTVIDTDAKLEVSVSASTTNQSVSNISSSADGAGTFNKTGDGVLSLVGDNSGFSGTANVNAGTLKYVADDASDKYFSGNTVITGILEAEIAQGISTTVSNISSSADGAGTFNKTGDGTLNLTGNNNNFTGVTNIEKGILAFTTGVGDYVGGITNIKSDGTLEYTVNDGLNDNITKVAGTGILKKLGAGTLNSVGDNSDFTGILDVESGTLAYATDTVNGNAFFNSVKNIINATLKIDNNDNDDISLNNVSGTGLIDKDGDAQVQLTGDNSGFSGDLYVSKGSVAFEKTADNSYINGNTKIDAGASLDYTTTQDDTLKNVSGAGDINKFGSGTLTLNGADNVMFNGTANINSGTLQVLGRNSSAFDFDINIKNDSILDYTAISGANITLGTSSTPNVKFANPDDRATANFNGGTYNLAGEIANASGNYINFDNATLVLSSSDYTGGSYSIKNSLIDLTQDSGQVSDRIFNNLTTENTSLDIDVNLTLPNPTTDRLIANAGGGAIKIALDSIAITDTTDNGENNHYEFSVLGGALTFDTSNSITNWATDVYQYVVKTENQNIVLDAYKASNNNSLKEMNQTENNRGFNFTGNDDIPYIIGESLDETAEGKFTVKGTGSTIVSGEDLKSFFEVVNNTDLTVKDLTIQDAFSENNGGSAVLADNANANILLDNVDITSGSSIGNGGVINNTNSNSFVINNANITNNSSTEGLGGAIYTKDAMTITDTNFSDNRDKTGSNDIYLDGDDALVTIVTNTDSNISSGVAGNGTINKTGAADLALSGQNKNFTGILNVIDGNVKFSQTTANDTYIGGKTVLYADTNLDITNDYSDIITNSFAGIGTINKNGSKDLTLTQDNSGFTGDVNINEGSISIDADSAKYFGGKTNINANGNLNIQTNNGTSLGMINGTGSLVKQGDGVLLMMGDNSNFTGKLDVQGGIFALASNSVIGQIAQGTFADGTSINLQNTLLIRNDDGTFTTNPSPASLEDLYFDNLTLNGNVGLNIDVDLETLQSDKIGAGSISGDGNLVLGQNSLNVISDSLLKNTEVQIAYGALAQGDYILLDEAAKTVMGPIQKYNVTYADGNLMFNRKGGITPDIDSTNPAIMASPVATQIGGYLTQLQTLQDGFFHMDRYTKYPHSLRLSAENSNKNALTETPSYQKSVLPETSQSMWVKPYTTFEKVQLKGGIDVSNVAYGTLYGGDSDIIDLGHGFKGVISTFIGYNGSHQSYNGISMNQQGGTLGITGTLYKGNFFTGLTASTGASAGEAYTQYGQDNFAMITAGVASKSGYNWELKDGKLIVQPTLFLGYTFVNTFDYTNAAGVKIDSDPLHAIQVVPGVKFVGNLKNGWQPYANVDMVWNIMDKTDVMANDVRLPQLSVKPYVQYGVGVQKTWGERFTGFFQTMMRNGGRNGVILTAGFRWLFGQDNDKNEKVQTAPKKTVLKQLKKPSAQMSSNTRKVVKPL